MVAFLVAGLSLMCTPPAGSDALWQDSIRYVVVGEIHGTAEAPAAFAQLACAAAQRGPVIVAVELSQMSQPQLDDFIEAPDAYSAEEILRGSELWSLARADGRTSVAMAEMLESIRLLKTSGADISLLAFQPSQTTPMGFSANYYELEMAALLAKGAKARPDARMLVLIGNLHGSKTRIESFDLTPAVAHLPQNEVTNLFVAEQGGDSWNCTDTCGLHEILAVDADPLGVTLRPYRSGRYDGVLAIGQSVASPPAASRWMR